MDDPLLVRCFEGLGDLLRDGQGFVDRQHPLAMRCDRSSLSTNSITSAVRLGVRLPQDRDHLLFTKPGLLHGSLVTPRGRFCQTSGGPKSLGRSDSLSLYA